MTATADEIAKLRRMVAEPTTATYSDLVIQATIETYPVVDARGEDPYVESTTVPGTLAINPDWTSTYDLHAAAAAIWEEKAAAVQPDFNFGADGGNYSRVQKFENAMKMAKYHLARRSANRSITQRMKPDLRLADTLIINAPESDP
jgi:hypothetical protein